jgi:integrase
MLTKRFELLIFDLFKKGNIMASTRCLVQGKGDNANVYIQFSISRTQIFKRKTGFVIDSKKWNKEKAQPIQSTDELKALKIKLEKLSTFIKDNYNASVSTGVEFSGEWLQLQIDLFNNKVQVVELDILTNYIQKYIDEAQFKQNGKNGTGLSSGRIQNLKLFKNTIKRYEAEELKEKSILIKDVNLKFSEHYKNWLFSQNYSINYVGKNMANLKTICNDAYKNDIETSSQIKNIKTISEKKAPEQIIYLNEQEQEQIKKAPIIREALINARKWLLLGCQIGQRGGDLLNITEKNIVELNGIKLIELKQQKTGKLVAIPLLPEALEIIESGFPYKISLARYNEYIKDVCEVAEINEPITAKIKVTSRNPMKLETKPKYKFITSHVSRRSFATNFYGRIPTPVLMNITAHGTEKVFLNYIGKTTYDNAYQMLEYFSKLAPKEKNTPQLEVIRNIK